MTKKTDLIGSLIVRGASQTQEAKDVAATKRKRSELMKLWASDPWEWLIGKDTDGSPIVRTIDEQALVAERPFPDEDYLHEYINVLHECYTTKNPINDTLASIVVIEKARRLLFTWTTLLYIDWLCRFHRYKRGIVCKSTEDEAKGLLKDKLRPFHKLLPEWIKVAHPVSETPADCVNYAHTGSAVVVGASNVAERESRGKGCTVALFDEAALQFQLRESVAATIPMARLVVLITTPNLSHPEAAQYFQDLLDREHMPKFDGPIPDFKTWTTPAGHRSIQVFSRASSAKRDPRYLESIRMTMKDQEQFEREFMGKWTAPSTVKLYPQYDRIRDDILRPAPGLLNAPICRGWDFGRRRPACVWMQVDRANRRIWVLRELLGDNISTHAFRDLVRYLSGQLDYDALPQTSKEWVCKLEQDSRYPEPPWFPTPAGARDREFQDFSGPEVFKTAAEVPETSVERQAAIILASADIHIRVWSGQVEARTEIIRNLMSPREDGTYGIYIDPACVLIDEGFVGGFRYKQPTPQNPVPSEVFKDGKYDNLHDALGYPIANIVELTDFNVSPIEQVGYSPLRQPVFNRQLSEDINWAPRWPRKRST